MFFPTFIFLKFCEVPAPPPPPPLFKILRTLLAIAPSSFGTVFDPSHPKNVICNKFFNLINTIKINKIKSSFVFLASKIVFNKLSPTYLHLPIMSKNHLHQTLIFLLAKVYSVQVFIQHTITNNETKLHSKRHFN